MEPISPEAAYWVAIAHLPNWSREKINDFFDRLLRNRFAFHDFFALKPEEWEGLFHFPQEEIAILKSVQEKFPYYATITQKISERGFDVVPVHSRFYSAHLREKLGKSHAPTLFYTKGNIALFNTPAACILGSNHGSGNGLIFIQNLVRRFVKEDITLITTIEPGYHRYILNLCLQFGGRSLVLLDQGVLSLKRPLNAFDQYVANGQVLFLSTVFPKNNNGKKWALQRDLLQYGLAKDIFIADAIEKREIWRWILRGLRQNKTFFVRYPEENEKSANRYFIANGAIPVDLNGKIIKKFD
ncbi:MAG: hypothetical protein GX432_00600 [Candidatus Atribacteria bacterium]|nr:hypothetical protein [Candidatus Atribacteria bacterium]